MNKKVTLAVALTVGVVSYGASIVDAKYELSPLYKHLKGTLGRMAGDAAGNQIFAIDRANSRIAILGPSGTPTRFLGTFGQGAGDLSRPMALTWEPVTHLLYVIDELRVKAFRPDGSFVRGFALSSLADSIAANRAGEVFLSMPRSGKMIGKYSAVGKELPGFGDLPDVRRIYPERHLAPPQADLNIALGRSFLISTPDGGVVAVSQYLPLIWRYSSTGHLQWETRMGGRGISEMERTFWDEPGAAKSVATKTMDGKALHCFVTAAALTSHGSIVLVLGNRTLLIFSATGQQTAALMPSFKSPSLIDGLAELGSQLYATSLNTVFASDMGQLP